MIYKKFSADVWSYLPAEKHIEKSNYEGLDSFFWYGMPNTFSITVDNIIMSFVRNHKH